MIRTMIVDDEPWARANLRVLLGQEPGVTLVGECGSGAEAKREIEALRPDLVFLDVQLMDCDGFEVLESLGAAIPEAVVFVTAYEQHALRAFEVAAIDYLLKPFDNERFQRAMRRSREALAQRKAGRRLIVRSAGHVAFLRTSEIDWIEAADYYACLHVGGRTHMMRRTLAELERELERDSFCRIHRSHIVNLARVRELRSDAGGEQEVVLLDGSVLRLSRSYKSFFMERLESILK